MSGNRGKKKRDMKRRRANSPYANHNISGIDQHYRDGNKLSPPLNRMPKMSPTSWMDDHMPEMLWAVLLAGSLDRKTYLACFRRVAQNCREWFLIKGGEEKDEKKNQDEELGINFTKTVDHTTLSEVSEERFEDFMSVVLSFPGAEVALRPLVLIDSLPRLDRWKRHLGSEDEEEEWQALGVAVAGVLDHQSEASTDIRWFKMIVPMISGIVHFPESMADRIECMRLYPDHGDMRSVRPFIRSMEIMARRSPPSEWIAKFWVEAFEKTLCMGPPPDEDRRFPSPAISAESLYKLRDQVIERFLQSIKVSKVDARLDSSFGLVLYALSIVEEVEAHRVQMGLLGRLALRSLVEACITLNYLFKMDKNDLWVSYRVYGAGQAKLAFLKAQEIEGDLPSFIDEDMLHAISNEDRWQEFLDINVGHWVNSNLRKLAIESGCKDLYDKYYDWSSTFVHCHWGAVRDTNFVTCGNPLHRLHRVPRIRHRNLNSIEMDAIYLVNGMVALLDEKYPGDSPLESLKVVEDAPVVAAEPEAQGGD